jgi:hypothetical protein
MQQQDSLGTFTSSMQGNPRRPDIVYAALADGIFRSSERDAFVIPTIWALR